MWIETDRIEPRADPEDSATFRDLGEHGGGTRDVDGDTAGPRRESDARQLQHIAAANTERSIRHCWTSVPSLGTRSIRCSQTDFLEPRQHFRGEIRQLCRGSPRS